MRRSLIRTMPESRASNLIVKQTLYYPNNIYFIVIKFKSFAIIVSTINSAVTVRPSYLLLCFIRLKISLFFMPFRHGLTIKMFDLLSCEIKASCDLTDWLCRLVDPINKAFFSHSLSNAEVLCILSIFAYL